MILDYPGEARRMRIKSGQTIIIDSEDYEWIEAYTLVLRDVPDPDGVTTRPRVQLASTRLSLAKLIARPSSGQKVICLNGDPLDLRKSNLSCVSGAAVGQRSRKREGTSRYKGVCLIPKTGKWRAYIKYQGRKYHLGIFTHEIDAAHAYDAKAVELYGSTADINLWNTCNAKGIKGYDDDRPVFAL